MMIYINSHHSDLIIRNEEAYNHKDRMKNDGMILMNYLNENSNVKLILQKFGLIFCVDRDVDYTGISRNANGSFEFSKKSFSYDDENTIWKEI